MYNNCIMCASKWCWKSGKYDENTCTGFINRTMTTYSDRTDVKKEYLKELQKDIDNGWNKNAVITTKIW